MDAEEGGEGGAEKVAQMDEARARATLMRQPSIMRKTRRRHVTRRRMTAADHRRVDEEVDERSNTERRRSLKEWIISLGKVANNFKQVPLSPLIYRLSSPAVPFACFCPVLWVLTPPLLPSRPTRRC